MSSILFQSISLTLILQWILASILTYIVISLTKWLFYKWRMSYCFPGPDAIPGPKPSFWFGNYPEYIRCPYIKLDEWCKKYGKYFGYYQGSQPVLVLNDVDAIQEVLVKLGKQFPNRQNPVLNVEPFRSSLINQRDQEWRHTRRVLTPPFTAHKLAQQSTRDAINESVRRLLNSVERQLKNNNHHELNITRNMGAVTLDVISHLAFNMKDTDVHEDDSKLRKMATQFMDDSSGKVLQFTTYFPILIKLGILYYNLVGGGKFLTTIINQLNNCIEDYFIKKVKNQNEIQDSESESKINILDYMIEQKVSGNLNDNQIIGNSIVILLAGYETTATALSYTFYLLAKHQNIQKQLREELNQNSTDDEDYCQFDRNRCELLDRVWYESLRLYPPVVTFITRELGDDLEEYELKNLNLKVTKDMFVQVPIWTLHHNPEYWPEPNQFNPFREDLPIPGSSGNKNKAFLAFGNGPRNCIGGNLALSEGRAVLVGLLKRYHFDLLDLNTASTPDRVCPTDPETGLLKLTCPTVIIHPEKDIWLRLTPIK